MSAWAVAILFVPRPGRARGGGGPVRQLHDLLPQNRWQLATADAVGGRVIVIAGPDPTGKIAAIANEPGVAIVLGGAGFASAGMIDQGGPVCRCQCAPQPPAYRSYHKYRCDQ